MTKLRTYPLRVKDAEALASFFSVWWAVVVLEPGANRAVRAHMAKLGLVEKRGKLALTAAGKRALAVARAAYE
jgi:hypothetical protein